MRNKDTVLAILQWARANGAVIIKIGDVDITFAPPDLTSQSNISDATGIIDSLKADNPSPAELSYDEWLERNPLPSVR